jgi:Alpha amylase, catalytic domain
MAIPNKVIARAPIRLHPHLYEINTWTWLEELSAREKRNITLADVPDAHWDALAKLGFNIIWLMGVWKRSEESRRVMLSNPASYAEFGRARPGWTASDVIGSPYSVAGYVPDARIGGWAALDAARDKMRARGMGLFLDFVGNHTALDHPWVQERPEYYVQGSQQEFERNPSAYYSVTTPQGVRLMALAKDPYHPPWNDVAQLNHFHPGMRAAQLADLRTIAGHCDGVRCDMAMLQLSDIFGNNWRPLLGDMRPPATEFWTEVRGNVQNLTLLAEAYWGTEQRLLDLGFSFAYDKSLYDAVRDINVSHVRSRLAASSTAQSHFARFMENHDEPRRPEVFPNERLAADGTLLGTLPGMRFYHQGELEGRRIRLPISLRISADEPADPVSEAFFRKILQITQEHVFHEGEWKLLELVPEGDASPDSLMVYEWRSMSAWKVIAVNLTGRAAQGRLRLGDRVSPTKQYIFYDELNDVKYPRSGEELHNLGLFIRRDGFQAHVFDVTAVA